MCTCKRKCSCHISSILAQRKLEDQAMQFYVALMINLTTSRLTCFFWNLCQLSQRFSPMYFNRNASLLLDILLLVFVATIKSLLVTTLFLPITTIMMFLPLHPLPYAHFVIKLSTQKLHAIRNMGSPNQENKNFKN